MQEFALIFRPGRPVEAAALPGRNTAALDWARLRARHPAPAGLTGFVILRWHAFQPHAGMLPSADAALARAAQFIPA